MLWTNKNQIKNDLKPKQKKENQIKILLQKKQGSREKMKERKKKISYAIGI